MLNPNRGAGRINFTIPAGAGTYDTQVLHLRADNQVALALSKGALWDNVEELVILVEGTPPLTSQVEVDLLRVGGDATVDADWVKTVATATAKGVYDPLRVAGWAGVRLRGKSGGTAGALPVSVRWH